MEGSFTWLDSIKQVFRAAYVVLVFCAAFFIGGLKALIVGPFAAAILIVGNIGVVLTLFPFHVSWTVYSVVKTNHVNVALKLAMLLALPVLFSLWLGLGIFGSILVGLGYGFFTPWISTFEAFRKETQREKFIHGIVDGTWGTIRGSCTVVRDFKDMCWHSYPLILKELREGQPGNNKHTIRFLDIPSCIIIGIMGVAVDVPLYTIIALIKSPYMLFKGWHRLLRDLISREGLFLETACIPVSGLAILFWPLVVVGSVVIAIVSSIFVGLYGAVIVYEERSIRRGAAYVVAVVAEFDEYTNDWLYLRDGTILPRPRYRKRKVPNSSELSIRRPDISTRGSGSVSGAAPGFLVPSLAPSRSVRETIQEVKMLQISENHMRELEMNGKELLDANVITPADLMEWLNSKGNSGNESTIGLGISSYTFLHKLVYSNKAGASGLLLANGVELTPQNRPQDRVFNWFFHPMMVLKEQMKVLKLTEEEVMFLEKSVLFVGDLSSASVASSWRSESHAPQDPLRAAQIQAISRRLVGITRSMTKFPTYRRRYRQVVKLLICYSTQKEGSICSQDNQPASPQEITQIDV